MANTDRVRSTRQGRSSTQTARARKGKKRWTVMVYMAAGKDEQTERAAISDIKEMEAADTTNVNVVVLLDRDWPVLPQIYRIVNGISVPICPEELVDEAYCLSSTQTRKRGSRDRGPEQHG